MIWYGKRIYKENTNQYKELTKGDAGFLEDKDLPEIVTPARFLLSEVIGWDIYSCSDKEFFKNTEEKIRVFMKSGDAPLLLCKLQEFDDLMKEYIKRINYNYKDN